MNGMHAGRICRSFAEFMAERNREKYTLCIRQVPFDIDFATIRGFNGHLSSSISLLIKQYSLHVNVGLFFFEKKA
jgi:hypothetical protein